MRLFVRSFFQAIMAELPLEASLSRMLIAAGEKGCSEEMLSIVAMLSVQDPFVAPLGKTRSVDAARRSFAVVFCLFVVF
jgi:HrpA-like RNA helicase